MYPKYLLLTLVAGVVAMPMPAPEGAAETPGALQARGRGTTLTLDPQPGTTFPDTATDNDHKSSKSRGPMKCGARKTLYRRGTSPNLDPQPGTTFPTVDDDDHKSSKSRGPMKCAGHKTIHRRSSDKDNSDVSINSSRLV